VNVTDEYKYDWNGNMKVDQNKGLSKITYNHLNLPLRVEKSETEYIIYTYDALGNKLAQHVFGSSAKTTDYLGELVFENNALVYARHDEGRIVPDSSPGAPRPWEYQYFLSDHLGSVRVVFSEKSTATPYSTNFESASAPFGNYNQYGVLNEYDHTDPGTTYSRSHLLHGENNSQIGASKSLAVNPGDMVDMEVYAKYQAPGSNPTNLTTLFNALVSAFALQATGGTGIDGQQAYNAISDLYPGAPFFTISDLENQTAPRAYLNFLLFDENFELVDFGFDQISIDAKQVGISPVVPHDYLSLRIQVKQKGYLYVYVSNEQPYQTNVHFDDFKIVHHTAVVQTNDYYPFGLTFNLYQRENSTPQDYKFNGKELEDELGLNWLDHGARIYQPEIGRWMVVDPLADKYTAWSPYAFSFNNPILFWDPTGMEGIVVSGQPGDHDNERHFLVNGLDRAKKMQKKYDKAGNGEKATWIVYNNGDPENGGYSAEVMDEYKKEAGEAGIELKVVSSSDEIVDYVNEKTGGDSRSKDQISDFAYVGHALPGELSVGYESHNWFDELTHDALDPADFRKEAFKEDANANLVGGCKTCVPSTFGKSAAEKMSEKVGGEVRGSDVRVYYPGGVVSDEVLVKKNGGQIIVIPAKGRKK
jgi:RHS repeat-associated protein